jgi:hypothetical protein
MEATTPSPVTTTRREDERISILSEENPVVQKTKRRPARYFQIGNGQNAKDNKDVSY